MLIIRGKYGKGKKVRKEEGQKERQKEKERGEGGAGNWRTCNTKIEADKYTYPPTIAMTFP